MIWSNRMIHTVWVKNFIPTSPWIQPEAATPPFYFCFFSEFLKDALQCKQFFINLVFIHKGRESNFKLNTIFLFRVTRINNFLECLGPRFFSFDALANFFLQSLFANRNDSLGIQSSDQLIVNQIQLTNCFVVLFGLLDCFRFQIVFCQPKEAGSPNVKNVGRFGLNTGLISPVRDKILILFLCKRRQLTGQHVNSVFGEVCF